MEENYESLKKQIDSLQQQLHKQEKMASLGLLSAGIAPNRVKTISNGKSKLAAQGDTEETHKLNRRDEFIAVTLMK